MNPSLRLLSAAFLLAASFANVDGSEPARIEEDFSKGRPDPHWWSVDTRNPPGVKVSTDGGSLRFVIPPGPAERPPAVMKGRFRLEGDFDIRADFSIESLPMPKSGWINVELFIEGAGGPASVMRTNHSTEGSGFSMWWEPPKKGTPGGWKHFKAESKQATLQLKRKGDKLTFHIVKPTDLLNSSGKGPGQIQLASVEYGTEPIDRLEVRVVVPETQAPVNVAFDNISIEAEQITEPVSAVSTSIGPKAVWYATVAAAVGFLAFVSSKVLREHLKGR